MGTQRKGRGRGRFKSSPKAISTFEKRLQVLELKKQGLSFDAIAAQLGYADRSGAYRAFKELLEARESESVDEYRAVMNEQLDALMIAHLPLATGTGKTKRGIPKTASCFSAEVVLKAIRERSKLNGCDAPIKTELSGELKAPAPHEDLLARLASLAAQRAPAGGKGSAGSEPDGGRG